MKTEIKLYGVLGKKFGKIHRIEMCTGSAGEAIRALSVIAPGFR